MIARHSLVTALVIFATLGGRPATAQDVALANANLVDPATETVTQGTLLITDGRITAVVDAVPEDFEGHLIDIGGRWVVPGFVDMHTHSFGNQSPTGTGAQFLGPAGTAKLALYTGVVAFLDLFSQEDAILGIRNRQRDHGVIPGATIFASGPCLTATEGHCSEYGVPTRIVDTPADADREIDELAEKNPDVVKLVYDHRAYGGRRMPTVDRATMEAVVEAAHRNGFKAVIHVGTWQDVRDAVLAGVDAVTHTPGPEPVPDDLAALMAERGTYHIPTLAVQSDFSRIIDDPSMLDDPLLMAVTTTPLREAYRSAGDSIPPRLTGWLAWQRENKGATAAAVRTLAESGVRMLTGTDGGNFGVYQGYSVHREMELLVEAGLSSWAALRAATTEAGAFLEQSWGLSPESEATLVILDASPVDDIRNTRRIHAVVQRGVMVDLETLLPSQ